jgi:hypothetical protein
LTLTTGDAAARAANTEAMLAYMDALRRTPGKFTTQLRNQGNAPKARKV